MYKIHILFVDFVDFVDFVPSVLSNLILKNALTIFLHELHHEVHVMDRS